MTLRDYFAVRAMQNNYCKLPVVDREGEFGSPIEEEKYNIKADIGSAYWIADAMLASGDSLERRPVLKNIKIV